MERHRRVARTAATLLAIWPVLVVLALWAWLWTHGAMRSVSPDGGVAGPRGVSWRVPLILLAGPLLLLIGVRWDRFALATAGLVSFFVVVGFFSLSYGSLLLVSGPFVLAAYGLYVWWRGGGTRQDATTT